MSISDIKGRRDKIKNNYKIKKMAIIVSKKLICVEAKKISFKGREGKLIEKFKYLFLDKDGNLIQGFLDTNDYEQDVQEINEGNFDELKQKFIFLKKSFLMAKQLTSCCLEKDKRGEKKLGQPAQLF